MKWLVTAVLLPFLSFSQSVKLNTYDNFIKKHRIELEPSLIYSSSNSKTYLSFSATASNMFLQLSGSGWGASTIDDGNELIVLFSNDSTITLKSVGVQSFEAEPNKTSYKHQYAVSLADVEALSKYTVAGIRKYSFKDYSDLSIPKESKSKIHKAGEIFLSELKKSNVIKTLKQVQLKEVAKYVGDSVRFCSKIYSARYYEGSENKPTVLDVQSNFSDPMVNVVIMEYDRKNFTGAPEKIYINKDVCISGVVSIRNNIPYITVRDREQIKVKSAPTLDDIGLFIDDSVTITGAIFSAKYFPESATSPTLLNMGAPFPNQPLTVVIEKADRAQFASDPEKFYLNKEVKVSGKVVLYKNKPQIVVRQLNQLVVVKENAGINGSSAGASDRNIGVPVFVATTNNGTGTMQSTGTNAAKISEAEKETAAEYPGGTNAWMEFLNTNLKIPEQLNVDEKKTVVSSFFVGVDGSVSNVKIIKSGGINFDKEVLRVLAMMPKWKPKTKGNYLMGVTVTQPITFKKVMGE